MSTQNGGITLAAQKRLLVSAGRSHPELAEEVAAQLGAELSPITDRDFANGEMFVRFE